MKRLRLLVSLSVLLVLTSGASLALWTQFLPLDPAELGPRYPVVRDGELSAGSSPLPLAVGVGGARAETASEREVIIRGRSARGRTWSLRTGLSFTMAFFHADLDRNGIPDLLIKRWTGGCGSAPSTHLIALLFDPSGMPVPFECDGFLEDTPGISDLFDMDRDGKAVLVAMHATSGNYWAWTLYKAENGRWRRLDGPRGKRHFPLFTSRGRSERPSRKAVTPSRATQDSVPDLATARPILSGATLASYRLDKDDELEMRVCDPQGRMRICHPARWHSSYSLVLDTREGRRIVQGSASRQAQLDILKAMGSARCKLELYGRRPTENPEGAHEPLTPELTWGRMVRANSGTPYEFPKRPRNALGCIPRR